MSKYLDNLEKQISAINQTYEQNITHYKKELVEVIEEKNKNLNSSHASFLDKKTVNQLSLDEQIAMINIEKENNISIFVGKKKEHLTHMADGIAVCEKNIADANLEYESKIKEHLDIQDYNEDKNLHKKELIDELTNPIAINRILELKENASALREMMSKSNTLFDEQMSEQKKSFVVTSTLSNDKIKDIKKKYLSINEELTNSKDLILDNLDEEIKLITSKYAEYQKEILKEFKTTLITIDKQISSCKRDHNLKMNKINLKYEKLILFKKKNLSQIISSLKKEVKKTSDKRAVHKQYAPIVKKETKELNVITKEFNKTRLAARKIAFTEVEELKLKQRQAELEKNKDININKINSDYEIMAVQEKIKLENNIFELEKKKNSLLELKEILEIEVVFSNEDNINSQDNRLRISDYSALKSDYELKLASIHAEIDYLENEERVKKDIGYKKVETNDYKNFILSNLAIEKAKIDKEFIFNLSKNKQEALSISSNYNISSYQLNTDKKNDVLAQRIIFLENLYKNKDFNLNFEFQKQEIINTRGIENDKTTYISSIEIERVKRILSISDSERKKIFEIINDLDEALNAEDNAFIYRPFSITNIKKSLNDNVYNKNQSILLYSGLIKKIIHNRIDASTAYKYNAFKSGINEDLDNERNRIENRKNDIQKQLNLTIKDIDEIEYEIVLKKHDLIDIINRKNSLKKEKNHTYENKNTINNFVRLITQTRKELNDTEKELLNKRFEANSLKKQLIKQDDILINANRIANDKIEVLSKKRKKEMHIYYKCLKKINKCIGVLSHIHSKRVIEFYDKIDEGMIVDRDGINRFIHQDINFNQEFIFDFKNIVNKLYRGVIREQKNNLRQHIHIVKTKEKKLYASTNSQIEYINLAQKKEYQSFLLKNRDINRRISDINEFYKRKIIELKRKTKAVVTKNKLESKKLNAKHHNDIAAIEENILSIRHYYTSIFTRFESNKLNQLVIDKKNYEQTIQTNNETELNLSIQRDKSIEIINKDTVYTAQEITKKYQKQILKLDTNLVGVSNDIEIVNKAYLNAIDELNYDKMTTIDDYMNKHRFDLSSDESEMKRNILLEFSSFYRIYRSIFKYKGKKR